MSRRTRRTAVAAIVTALVSIGGLPPAQAVASVAPQADERRSECVRQQKVSGMPVRSLLCLRFVWDESAGTTTLVAKLRVVNGTRSTRRVQIWLSTEPGAFTGDNVYEHTLAPRSTVTYTEWRRLPRYLDEPVAKSRVFIHSGGTNGYSIQGKTLRATP